MAAEDFQGSIDRQWLAQAHELTDRELQALSFENDATQEAFIRYLGEVSSPRTFGEPKDNVNLTERVEA